METYAFGIAGLGLIGGSLARALKKHDLASNIIAYDYNEPSLLSALRDGVIDEYSTKIDSTFKRCDIIFLCLPVEYNIEVARQLKDIISNDCILTDVGSTKKDIMDKISELSLDCTFIGGHPMTGSEKSGYSSSKSYLFENAYYILCPFKGENPAKVNIIQSIIKKIGALTVIMDCQEHDYVTASISHVPHVIASLLVNLVEKLDNDNRYMYKLAAGGFKDLTRIASSSPVMWEQICSSNKDKIIEVLEYFNNDLNSFKEKLLDNNMKDVHKCFLSSKEYRDSFQDIKLNPLIKTYDLKLDVEDQPGIIAEVASQLSKHHINIKNIGIINNREHENGILEICFYDPENRNNSIEILQKLNYSVYAD